MNCVENVDLWIAARKREELTDSILSNHRVCSKHFISDKLAALKDTTKSAALEDRNPDSSTLVNGAFMQNQVLITENIQVAPPFITEEQQSMAVDEIVNEVLQGNSQEIEDNDELNKLITWLNDDKAGIDTVRGLSGVDISRIKQFNIEGNQNLNTGLVNERGEDENRIHELREPPNTGEKVEEIFIVNRPSEEVDVPRNISEPHIILQRLNEEISLARREIEGKEREIARKETLRQRLQNALIEEQRARALLRRAQSKYKRILAELT